MTVQKKFLTLNLARKIKKLHGILDKKKMNLQPEPTSFVSVTTER